MKLEHYFTIVCILGIACILMVGCEKVSKPMMDAVDMAMVDTGMPTEMGDIKEPETPAEMDDTKEPETPAEMDTDDDKMEEPEMEAEPPLPTIDFKPEIEQPPALPEGFEMLPGDDIKRVTELFATPYFLNEAGEPDLNGTEQDFGPLVYDDAASVLSDTKIQLYFDLVALDVAEWCQSNNFIVRASLVIHFPHPNRAERDRLANHFKTTLPEHWQVFDDDVRILNDEEVYYTLAVRLSFSNYKHFCQ